MLPPPRPVRLCRVCWTTHHPSTTGVVSRELEEWYCSEACRYVQRLKMGLLSAKDTPGVYKEVLKMIEKHYQPDVLNERKHRVMHRLQVTREERAIATVIDGRPVEE